MGPKKQSLERLERRVINAAIAYREADLRQVNGEDSDADGKLDSLNATIDRLLSGRDRESRDEARFRRSAAAA